MHLVGFIIRIYHDARSPERQISKVSKREELVHLVGFIIRIYHDARSAERQISKVSGERGISASSWFYYKNLSRCTVS